VLVDVLSAGAMRRDASLMTSVRTLARPPYGPFARGVLVLCRSMRVMGPREVFDGDSVKTKAIFMATQAVYTLLTLLPARRLAASANAHLLAISGLLLALTWNGANFYFDVFAKRYEKELQRTDQAWRVAETRRIEAQLRAQIAAAAAAESPRSPNGRPPPGQRLAAELLGSGQLLGSSPVALGEGHGIPSSGSLPVLPSSGGYALVDAVDNAGREADDDDISDCSWHEPADSADEGDDDDGAAATADAAIDVGGASVLAKGDGARRAPRWRGMSARPG